VLVLLLAVLLAQVLPFVFSKSGVCDEHGAHIPSGYVYLSTGVFSGGINNPPLMQLIVAAPLVLSGIEYNPFSDHGLWAARLPVLGLSIILGLAVYFWAGSLYGRAAALAALFLFCLEPNVIAHSGLATLDMGVTVFLFLAFLLLWKSAGGAGAVWWMAACLSMTLALLCKFTALFLLPVFVLLLVVSLLRNSPRRRSPGRVAIAIVFLGACFVTLSHLVYHIPFGPEKMPAAAHVSSAHEGRRSSDPAAEEGQASGPVAAPEAEVQQASGPVAALGRAAKLVLPDLYVEGSLGKLRHSEGGHFAYLAGKRSLGGWWYYFPAAIVLKTPIPLLCLFMVSLVLWIVRIGRERDAVFLFLPMLLYVVAMAWTGVNIGVRHVLLFFPCAAVAGSAVLASGVPKNKLAAAVLIACAVWYAAGSAKVFPHYLAYFNEIAGGPEGGPRYLIDSNIDWGQDEGLLKEFVSQEADTVLVNPGAFSPSVGTVAVNVNSLFGIFRGDDTAYGWIRGFEPSAMLGYTWYVYRIAVEDYERAASESPGRPEPEIWLATARKKAGRLDDGLALLRGIAAEYPDRAGNVLNTAGWWLLEAGRRKEAEAAFEEAVERGAGREAYRALLAARAELKREAGEAAPSEIRDLGEYFARLDRTEWALRALEEGIAAYPTDAGLRLSLALLYGREGDFVRAAAHAAAAASLDPSLERARWTRDWADSMQRMKSAEGDYEAHMELGRYEGGFGRPRSAAGHFWDAFRINPSSQAALAAMGDVIVQGKLGTLELEPPASPEAGRP
jgi:4-amino-4-deoxy-L-arabinose transferase-like glycosyltransferase/tetratricopeptide (TPR) repeat protein